MRKTFEKYHHLHQLPVNPTSPQLSWSRSDHPGPAFLPYQADNSVPCIPPVGVCSCGTNGEWNSRKACKNQQSGSADTKPCHLQRGQDIPSLTVQKRLDEMAVRHTLTWSGDQSRFDSPLFSAFAYRTLWSECTSEEDWHYWLFLLQMPTSWPNHSMLRGTRKHGCMVLTWRPSCGSTEDLYQMTGFAPLTRMKIWPAQLKKISIQFNKFFLYRGRNSFVPPEMIT